MATNSCHGYLYSVIARFVIYYNHQTNVSLLKPVHVEIKHLYRGNLELYLILSAKFLFQKEQFFISLSRATPLHTTIKEQIHPDNEHVTIKYLYTRQAGSMKTYNCTKYFNIFLTNWLMLQSVIHEYVSTWLETQLHLSDNNVEETRWDENVQTKRDITSFVYSRKHNIVSSYLGWRPPYSK